MFNVVLGRAARRLAELAPGDLQISFWCNSGTEAIEGAIKLARAATGRAKIVGTHNAFHGKTLGALSVSGRETFQTPFRPLLADSSSVPFGETEASKRRCAMQPRLSSNRCKAREAYTFRRLGYLRKVRDICDATGALFIADEIQTGFGRCGYRFASDRDDAVPDVMTLAKGLSGGVVPVGAFIARAPVWNRAFGKAPLLHTSTFGGSEIACAAAIAAMDVLEEEGLVQRARDRGEQLLRGAQAIAAQYPAVVREARGLGLLVGVELTSEGYGGWIIPEMLKHGVTAAWTLNAQRVIRLEPPLIVSEAEVDRALEALRAGVATAYEKFGEL